jgi:hypothetical protein
VFIKSARQDSDILPGDASFVLRRYMWPQWSASEDYTAGTLPVIIGSIGGLFAAFTGALAAIFGTSVGFVFFGEETSICSLMQFVHDFFYSYHLGSKPISINPLLKIGENKASERLVKHYLEPGKEITAEARRNAVTAYLADFLVDTGELNLTPGWMPSQRHASPQGDTRSTNQADSDVPHEYIPLTSPREDC